MAIAAMSIISPRSGNYDRLEGGMGPSRTGVPPHQRGWRRFAWKKFAIVAGVLITVVWLWGPRERGVSWETVKEYGKGLKDKTKELIPFNPVVHDEHDYAAPAAAAPLSFETDPDASKTTQCTSPADPTKPLVQFALMIDAGSTGSRIHVYKFNNCKKSPTYEYEVFKMIQPGLSKFPDEPLHAARTLDPLLDEAVRVVPEALQHCTPVAVKATAGLRLLGADKSDVILHTIEERIRKNYPFQLPEKDGVIIMDGKDEGVYAWITANYLLGAIAPGHKKAPAGTNSDVATYAVLDLGGASTQIVFEPAAVKLAEPLKDGEHKYDLDFAGAKYELYQHSYLGYGLMKARSHVHRVVDFMATIRPRPDDASRYHAVDADGDGAPDYSVVPNPCLARGTERRVEVTYADAFFDADEDDGADGLAGPLARNVTMAGLDVGAFGACDRVVQLVLAKDALCETKPCAFNGVYQPDLLAAFKGGKVLLLSYFYDRIAPLLPPPGTTLAPAVAKLAPAPPLTVSSIATYAKTMCGGPDAWAAVPHWAADAELMEEIRGRPEWCLDLTFQHGLLRWGYEFEESRPVEFGKQIGGTELGWCLGATLALVGAGDVKCRA